MPVKLYVLVSFFITMVAGNSYGQDNIEKFLLTQKLASGSQYKKYKEEEKSDDEYVRLMLRLMKKEKEDREYVRKEEKEYKDEKAAKEQNKDTLLALSRILSTSCKKKQIPGTEEPGDSPGLKKELIGYVDLLKTVRCVSEENAKNLYSHIEEDHLYDSCSVINQAIGFRDKAIQTRQPELLALMVQLKDLKILSERSYQKLLNEPFPDSINKIRYIVSLCEKTFLTDINRTFIRDRNDFFLLVNGLAKLTDLDISDIKNNFITLQSDTNNFAGIPVISLTYKGRRYSHLCYEVSTTSTDSTDRADPFRLTGHDFYRVLNLILAYIRSPYRIYEIQENNPLNYTYTFWSGFIMLTDSQRSALYNSNHIDLSLEDHVEQLEEQKILRAVEVYKKTGLLRNISSSSIDSAISSIKEDPVYRYNELISRFTAVSVTVDERIPLTETEAIGLLNKMATISNHSFNPVNIRIEKVPGNNSVLLFEEKGITRRQEFFSTYISWDGVWHLIHECVFLDPNRKGQFEVLRTGQYQEVYIYVSPAQIAVLEKEKVIGDY